LMDDHTMRLGRILRQRAQIRKLYVRGARNVAIDELFYNDFSDFTKWLERVNIERLSLGSLTIEVTSSNELNSIQQLRAKHLHWDGAVFETLGNIEYPVD